MNNLTFKKDVYNAELKRISACIPLTPEAEKYALKLLNKSNNYSIENVFKAIKMTINHFNIKINVVQLAGRTSYNKNELKDKLKIKND